MRIYWMDVKWWNRSMCIHSIYNWFCGLGFCVYSEKLHVSNQVALIVFLFQIAFMCDRALNRRDSSTDHLWYYKGNWVDEVLIFVCQNEKGMCICGSLSEYHLDTLFHLITFLKLSMQKQNPENYLVRKGTSSDHKERDMQGAFIIHWYNCYSPPPLLISVILYQRFVFRKLMSYRNIKWSGPMKMVSCWSR